MLPPLNRAEGKRVRRRNRKCPALSDIAEVYHASFNALETAAHVKTQTQQAHQHTQQQDLYLLLFGTFIIIVTYLPGGYIVIFLTRITFFNNTTSVPTLRKNRQQHLLG